MRHLLSIAIFSIACLDAHAADHADFDRKIASILVNHCLDCHGGPKPKGGLDLTSKKSTFRGGENGPALVAGKPEQSPLWQRIAADEMPPKKPLSTEEKAALKSWIAADAVWGSDPIDPFRTTSSKRAGYDWWALQPLTSPKVPEISNRAWRRNPIDAFIAAKLESNKLKPSLEADRRTLIRRLSYDLLGLPPSSEEINAFLNDNSTGAYDQLVDRLLASPHFGERWARHWLDVVRFGESNGFERDLPRTNAWPYRDWVINAFNSDMPYDEFVRQQLAGDVFHPGNRSAIMATGFLVAGAHDTVMPVSVAMQKTMQNDELEDVIGTTGQAFLGLTVQCARCHDHKFDPISQKDYYQLSAALGGVQHGERDLPPIDSPKIHEFQRQIAKLQQDIHAIEDPIRQKILGQRTPLAAPKPLAEWDFTQGLTDQMGQLHVQLRGSASRGATGLRVDGKGYAVSLPLKNDLKAKSLEAWVRLDQLDQRGGSPISVQTHDGQLFDAIVFGEQEPRRWMAGSTNFVRTRSFQAPLETEANRDYVHVAITYASDGTITCYRNGQQHGTPYKVAMQTFKAGESEVIFGLRHSPESESKMLAGLITKARLYDHALTADEVAASARMTRLAIREDEMASELTADQLVQRYTLNVKLNSVRADLERFQSKQMLKIYANVPRQPGKTHLLIRGEVTQPGIEVVPAGIAALPGADWKLKGDAADGERRRKLAEWMTGPAKSLLARVIVNRIWHYHFGVGLVETPNDFGFNGGRPSHPELLDWLAAELIANGWKLKPIHKLILLSATYRQSSLKRPEAMRIDASNRLVWSHSPQRLEAESVRDAMLVVSGKLDRTIGGQGYTDFKSYFFKGTQFYDPLPQVGPEFYRRSIYRMWARGGRNPFLDTFDCPDPSTTAPRRAVTTTPIQALALLNNAFVLSMSDLFAQRARSEKQPIDFAYMTAFGRLPSAAEKSEAERFVSDNGFASFCRVIFNSNEFIYVD